MVFYGEICETAGDGFSAERVPQIGSSAAAKLANRICGSANAGQASICRAAKNNGGPAKEPMVANWLTMALEPAASV